MQARKNSADRQQHRYGMVAVFSLNTFAIVAVIMLALSGLVLACLHFGIGDVTFWTHPATLAIITVLVCVLLSSAILVMANKVVFQPIRQMNEALGELAAGRFDTRLSADRATIDEIGQFVAEFNATAAQLGEVEVLRTGFIDDFSHEMKTPIASINGFARLLQEEGLTDAERREYAAVIAEESGRLAALSDALLTLRRVESVGALAADSLASIDVAEQLRRRLIVVEQAWAAKELAFEVRLADAAVCHGDAALLERVWANLLDNAAKFSEPGGTVRVYCRPSDESVLVRICNGGVSIPPHALPRVFDRFYQADPSHSAKGNGLGLPLVKRVVELHNGTVTVTSDEVETCFEVRLPAR